MNELHLSKASEDESARACTGKGFFYLFISYNASLSQTRNPSFQLWFFFFSFCLGWAKKKKKTYEFDSFPCDTIDVKLFLIVIHQSYTVELLWINKDNYINRLKLKEIKQLAAIVEY